MGRQAEKQCGTGPGVSARRAQDLRIGDRVICGEHPLTVTSTRLQGVRGGTVSVGFAEQGERVSFAPNELLDIQDSVGAVRLGRGPNGRW
ncbi:hypothetical protein ACVBEQ_17960 [Nakamurella sp. GG22]